jgi:hypothetical protein
MIAASYLLSRSRIVLPHWAAGNGHAETDPFESACRSRLIVLRPVLTDMPEKRASGIVAKPYQQCSAMPADGVGRQRIATGKFPA